jgi:hypothetical protein
MKQINKCLQPMFNGFWQKSKKKKKKDYQLSEGNGERT